MSARKTVVVLEHVWDDFSKPSNKDISVLPYVDGVCRLHNYELHYGKYVGSSGFREWFSRLDSILSDKDRRIILYIAGHGSSSSIGANDIDDVLQHLWGSSNTLNVEGCIFGGCFVGQNIDHFKAWMTQSNLTWIVGYKHAVDWLPSTLCDISIISNLLSTTDKILSDRSSLESSLQNSVDIFNPTTCISTGIDKSRYDFKNTLSCVIQPRRQGQKPIEIQLF